MKPKFEGVLHMFGVDAKVSPGVVLPGLQGDWPLLLWDNVPDLVVNLVGFSSHGTPSEGCEEFRWAFLVGARWYIGEYRILVQFLKEKMVKRCCRTEQHKFSDVSLGPWRLTPHNLIPPLILNHLSPRGIQAKSHELLRRCFEKNAYWSACMPGTHWRQQDAVTPAVTCMAMLPLLRPFCIPGQQQDSDKDTNQQLGSQLSQVEQECARLNHHRCQWNSKNARHIRTHFQVFQQMISPWPVPMIQHLASFPQNQICKSKQSTLPPILMVQWRMGPYKTIVSSTISGHFPLSPWFMGGNCN